LGKKHFGFDDEVIQLFHQYPWHGNLRELKNVINRAALLCDKDKIRIESLPFEISHHARLSFPVADYNGHTDELKEQKDHHPNLKLPQRKRNMKPS